MSEGLPPLGASGRRAAGSSASRENDKNPENEEHADPEAACTDRLNYIPGYLGDLNYIPGYLGDLPQSTAGPQQPQEGEAGRDAELATKAPLRKLCSWDSFPETPSARDLAASASLITTSPPGTPIQPRRLFDSPQQQQQQQQHEVNESIAGLSYTARDTGLDKRPRASLLGLRSTNNVAALDSGHSLAPLNHRGALSVGDRDSSHVSNPDAELSDGGRNRDTSMAPLVTPHRQPLIKKDLLKRSCSDSSSSLRREIGTSPVDGAMWGTVFEEGSEGGEDDSEGTKRITFADGKCDGVGDKGKRVLLRMQSCPTELERGRQAVMEGNSIRHDGIVNVANLISQRGLLLTPPALKGAPMFRRASVADTPGARKLTKLSSMLPNRRTLSGNGGAAVQQTTGRRLTASTSMHHHLGDPGFDAMTPYMSSPYMSFSTTGGQSPAATLTAARAASMTAVYRRNSRTQDGGLRRQSTHTAGRRSNDDAGQPSTTSKLRRMSSAMKSAAHYLSLVVAEHPMEEHQRFLELEEEEEELHALQANHTGTPGYAISSATNDMPPTPPQGTSPNASFTADDTPDAETGGSIFQSGSCVHVPAFEEGCYMTVAKARWLTASETIIRSHYLYTFAAIMTDAAAAPSDRLHAIVHMEWMLWDNPNKRKVVSVLTNLVKGRKPSVGEMLHVELTMTGERLLRWVTPAEMDQHRPYFSLIYVIFILTTFFFMAGEFAVYVHTVNPSSQLRHGPQRLVAWLSPNSDLSFDFDYLREWGSRYAPDIADGQWYRWYTSIIIHASFLHMFSNLLLTLALSMNLETKYGAWRIALVWVISCGGGQLISAVGEDPCGQFVGSSGGVFGMMGLFIADMIVNFHTISRPILRCLLIFLFNIFFVMTIIRDVNTSHLSHFGGLSCGLLPAFLFLPKLRLHVRRWDRVLSVVGTIAILAVFLALPTYLYAFKFSKLCCAVMERELDNNNPKGKCQA